MTYTIDRIFPGADFDEIDARTRKALADNGFGVLTEIDVQATLKKKLGLEMKPFRILGACNPPFAHQALEMEPLVSVLLPCNVVVIDEGETRRVAAMDPGFMGQVIHHPEMETLASKVRESLCRVLRGCEGDCSC